MGEKYNIGKLPFYYTALPVPYNPKDLPNKLEFTLVQDKNGLIKQVPSEREQAYLSLAYQKGSQISGLMDDDGIGKLYADDFIQFICKAEENIVDKKILEIGCGSGYLLYRLKIQGGSVIGIEPGPHGLAGSKKYGIPIFNEFFNPKKITEKYDIVIFYGVLEHMIEVEKFLQDVKSVLKADGKIFLSVPDCEPYIQAGDLSMLMHEHYNYFTKDTLESLVENNGLEGDIIYSEFAGTLYASLKIGKKISNKYVNQNMLSDYIKRTEIQGEKVLKWIGSIISSQTLGIYVPGRMINILSICYEEIPKRIRFFDDNTKLHNTYFPGIDISIESFEDFENYPVDVMLIASFTFGNEIKKKILESGIKCKVLLLGELMSENSNII